MTTKEISANPSAHGLKKEVLSYGEVLAQSVAVIAPTTVPAAVLSFVFASSGNGTWLSFLLGAIGLVFVGININQFARRSASPGSLYCYIAKGLGPNAGVFCAWGLILAYLFTGMSTLCGFAIFGQKLLGDLGLHTHILTLFAVGTAAAWYVAYKDIQLSAKMILILEGVSIVSILLLGLVIWAHKGFAIDTAQLTLQGATPGGVTSGIVLAVFGFSGFESSTSLGDEAKNPLLAIPKSVLQSTLLAGIFFIVMAYFEVLGFRDTALDLGKSEAPLDFLAHQAGVDFLGVLISLGALLSFFSCTLGCINPTARVFFTITRLQQSGTISFLSPQIYNVAAVVFANGSDNIGIYVPLFANSNLGELLVIIGILFLLVGVWCYTAYQLTNLPTIIGYFGGDPD